MKNRILSLFCVVVLTLSFLSLNVYAQSDTIETKNHILNYNFQKYNVQNEKEFVSNVLPQNIGIDSEWYVIALAQSGEYNFSAYETALNYYINNKTISSASTRLKFALAFSAIDEKNPYIENTLNSSMGKQGIMSIVYGLHLLNNGYTHDEYTTQKAVDELLSLQLQDGGWSLNKTASDVDVTAMTIQALSPYRDEAKVENSIKRALDLISSNQLEDGDFLSYGVSNPESGSQVIIALSSLGIDVYKDERFIKNGKTLVDGVLKYRLNDGSFSHTLNGTVNLNSTVQAFLAFSALERFAKGKGSLYILDNISLGENSTDESSRTEQTSSTEDISQTEQTTSTEDTSQTEQTTSTEDVSQTEQNISDEKQPSVKIIICGVIIIVCAFSIVLLVILRKNNKKNIITLLLLSLILIIVTISLDIQTKEQYYNGETISKSNVVGVVSLEIKCDAIIDKSKVESHIPADGVILPKTEFEIAEGETVYDILIEAARKYSIHIDSSGGKESAYISGINYIYEFDFGDLSGWKFYVDGKESSVGCSSYALSGGENIEWEYVLTLGDFQ